MRIGIIGGSFNPIHIAHLIIADRFCDQVDLDQCMFVPAAHSPFKIDDQSLAAPEHRLAMVRLAIEQHPRFTVNDVELRRGGVSYSIAGVSGNPSVVKHSYASYVDHFCSHRKWKSVSLRRLRWTAELPSG